MCEIIVRSPFCVNCGKQIPLSQFFYTSIAIDASDKYQVWSVACLKESSGKKGDTRVKSQEKKHIHKMSGLDFSLG